MEVYGSVMMGGKWDCFWDVRCFEVWGLGGVWKCCKDGKHMEATKCHGYFIYPTRCNLYNFLYYYQRSTCFWRFFRPSSGAYKIVCTALVIVMCFPAVYCWCGWVGTYATYTVFFIIISALHVSGGFSAHHQELIKLYVQPWVLSCFPAVYCWCGWVGT